MRHSERPEIHEWARKMVKPFAKKYPDHRSDFEGEALLALVKAERHPQCPAPIEEFRRFACPFVRRAAGDMAKGLFRYRRKFIETHADPATKILAPEGPDLVAWADERRAMAGRLDGLKREVFLKTYGDEEYRERRDVAAACGISEEWAKRVHKHALAALRDDRRAA
jgi:hypothetical protein